MQVEEGFAQLKVGEANSGPILGMTKATPIETLLGEEQQGGQTLVLL
jgi:hypothetical protein